MKTKNNIGGTLAGSVLLASCLITSANAAPLAVTNTFVDAQVLSASELNTNFGDVKTAVDDNDANVNTNSINIGINDTAIADHETRVINLESSSTPRTTVTVNRSGSVGANSFRCLVAQCPLTHPVAISGGVDSSNVLTMSISQSSPSIGTVRPLGIANGSFPDSSIEWRGCVVNNAASSGTFHVVAICSDQ